MPDQPFDTFLSSRSLFSLCSSLFSLCQSSLFSLCQKEYNILVKNCIFDDPFHKKWPVLATNYFGASEDQTIRIRRFFEKIGLQLRTSESSRFLHSLIWALISLNFAVMFWKNFFWQNHENSCWILAPVAAVGGCRGCDQKSLKWLVRHNFPLLRNSMNISFW